MTVKESLIEKYYLPLRRFCFRAFGRLKVDGRKVVVVNRGGFGDSPKYVALELLQRRPDVKVVWLLNNRQMKVERPVRPCHYFHIPALYHLATARVVITTDKGRFPFCKKPGQKVLYIPHGCFGGKFTEGRALTLPDNYVKASQWHSSQCDLFISPNTNFSADMRECYWYDGEIMESGLPRNDVLFARTQSSTAALRRRLGLPEGVSFVLYAPTFRDSSDPQVFALDMPRLLDALERRTGRPWMGLVTWHPNFIYTGHPHLGGEAEGRVIDLSAHPDMQELLMVSDCLVSDYSSTMFDFFLMRRPIFLFTLDLEDYRRQRGLFPWFMQAPFPFCRSNDELESAVMAFDPEAYGKALDSFSRTYGSVDDGHATERVTSRIESWLDPRP